SLTLPQNRQRLAALMHKAKDVIHIEDAAHILQLSSTKAAQVLSRWTSQGWLRRVGHGVYVPTSLDLLDRENVLTDPWILVPHLFAPAYIGGRTAAEHWDLTEQIFNDIVVLTTRSIREKSYSCQGAVFTLNHIKSEKLFGTKVIWRGRSQVLISDIHRT